MSPTTADAGPSPTRTRRIYRPAAERRAQIVAAAQAAFIRSTFAGARTRDIAAAAGVNQATLFKHFPTKERLFEEAVLVPLVEAMRGVYGRVDVYATAETPDELAELAESSATRHIEDMQRIFPLLATALFSDLELGRKLYRDHLEPLIRQRGEMLRPLVRDGIDPAFVGLASFGMLFAVAMQRWLGGEQDAPSVTATQLTRVSTGGFARSGRRTSKRDIDTEG